MNRQSRILAQSARRQSLKAPPLPALTTMAMVIGSLVSGGAHANPTGGNVVAGGATINDRGNGTLDINQSTGKAIINWKDFSIGANETVNFRQPGSNSITLNRVVGNDPSAIFGRLNANGTVMLVNPNGVLFGKGARIDVGGLVATTANISDKDFLAGKYKFDKPSSKANAMIVNEGTISIKDSGLAVLVAPAVRNSGVIEAKLGRVALAGAKTVTVDFHGDGLLSFDATSTVNELPRDADGKPVSALVTNAGVIRADGGTVLMTARAVKGVIDNVVNTDGIVSAKAVGTQNGKIVLSGGDAGTVNVAGTVEATGANAGERGGKVVVTGEHVNVARGAAIDVSGAAGGGEIALGSQGVAPDDGSAAFSGKSSTVKVAAGATLKADALVNGKGGNVTMWSNDATAFAGSLSARGGAQGGDGGFAEVSSNKNIGLTGSADLRAPKGKTGLLLIDPTDLRIVDSASGSGSQDGAAGDGTINGGDANTANNTVSRGLLESLAGTTNIKLEATGQITVADMAAINLKTTSGHSFTMRSTQTGGIRFENANTEISTQGGSITLEALGVGSTLDNIGKLTSRGGAITLNATGDINLANVIDAGSGAALVRTSAGSIRNTGGANQVVAGGSVKLDASGGNIGDPAAAVNTRTAQLSLATGGNLAVANRQTLTSLDITSRHAQPGVNNSFQLTSPDLAFALQDNGSYQLSTVTQPGLNFSFTGDRTITAGNIDLGSGALALTSTAGHILGTPTSLLKAGFITLSAAGSDGRSGAIGSSAQGLNTQTASLTATSGTGGVYLNNTGSAILKAIDTTGSLVATTTGNLTLGDIKTGASAVLTSALGNIVDDGVDATTIATSSLTLAAANGTIGTGARSLKTSASSLSAVSSGGVYLDSTSSNLNITQAQAANAAITITGAGSVSANNVSSGGGAVNLTGNSINAGQVNAGSGNVTLTARAGSITGTSASLITGNVVTLLAPASNTSYTVGTAGTYLRTAAGELHATGGSIFLNQAQGSVLLDDLKANNGIYVTGVANLTANQLDAGNGTLSLNAQGGSVLRANANSVLAGSSVNLQALQHLGTASEHLTTATTSLTLGSGGDIFIDNPGKTLTYLAISNSHADPARRNTLQVAAPFLTFDINDNLGNAYELRQVYSSLLNQFSFTGDQSLKLGNLRAGSVITLTSTLGSILDDGIADTRVTASNVSLTANQDIGTAANYVAVNAPSLSLDTRGNLYATNIADLNSLSVTARHKSADDHYVLDVRAPSLLFNITDDASGHTIREVRDANSVNFSFTSDRDITAGSIDAGYSGSITLNAAGDIRDDGNKQTRLLANAVNLIAGKAVGASGAGYLDIIAGSLSGSAGNGGFYVQLPHPTGSSNTTGTVTLNNITATDDVRIDTRQGDALLSGTVRSWNGAVALNVANGSLFGNGTGNVYAGGNDILLTAAGAIGGVYNGSLRYIGVGGSGQASVQATAGTDVYLNGTTGNIKLTRLEAGSGQIGYTQASGNTTIGSLSAAGAATLANTGGSLLDDGDAATQIRASSIALAAGGSIGATGAALTLQAPDVSLASGGGIAVDNLVGLTRLNITRNGTANATYAITAPNLTAFTVTDDASGIHLKNIASATNLDFGFTANSKNLLVGSIDAGANGKVSLTSNQNISNDDPANSGAIRASTVALTAGTGGSIGSSVTGGGLVLNGTSALSLTAGNHFYVSSDTVLRSLAINSLKAAGSASTFEIGGGAGQTIRISDDGTTQYLEQVTGGLTDFSFSGRKNIQAGTITATNSVNLATTGGGVNSSITSDGGAGRITANSVTLSATGSDSYTARDANTGAIGAGARALRVTTSNLAVTNNGDINLNNGGQALSSLNLYLSRRDAGSSVNYDTNSYAFAGMGGQSLSLGSGTNMTIGANMQGAALTINTDTAITSNTINAGSGSVSLTTRYVNSDLAPSIGGSGLITGNSVSLSALGTNGSVFAKTSTSNLSIASAGNVNVANDKQLDSLSLTANHSSSNGAVVNTYAISATGMTEFSLNDSTDVSGLTLSNIINTDNLALSISSDRALTVNKVTTAAGGSVTLASNGTIYGNGASAPNITTGALTLNASSVTGTYATNQPLFVSVDSLSSNIRGSLWVSNNKSLTLLDNSATSSAQVNVTNGSITQGAGRFVTPALTLTAAQSIGGAGNAVQTDTRQLTTQSGGNLYVNNASDLFSLNITANHANSAVDNVLQVAAKGLTFNVTDAGAYAMTEVSDLTGLNFSFGGDRTLYVGNVDVGPANTVSLDAYGSGANILNLSPTSHITGDVVTLRTSGQIGVASGDDSGSIHTTTSELYLTAGSDVYVDNDRDLASLSLYATGSAPATYQIQSNELLFDVAHNGSRLQVNQVRDNTGLNLMLSSNVGQDIGIIDTQPTGTVRLSSNNSILGSADDSQRITAAQVNITTQGSGAIGAVGREINLSAPIVSIQNAGDVYVDSDTHIDSLTLYSTGNAARSYGINSPTRDGGNIGFQATDGGSGSSAGLVLSQVIDQGGLNLSVTSDRTITVGKINVGNDNVTLTSRGGSLLGDGDSTTKIDAAALTLTANNAIGAAGAGNAIDTRVSTLNGRANGGGAYITVEGNTSLPSLVSTGASSVSNTTGDIELGTVNTNGNAFTVNNTGGSILSGTINNATTVNLTANGSIGNKSAIRTTALANGTTTVNLSATKTDRADGSIALTEAYGLQVASASGAGDITLSADTANNGRNLTVGTITSTDGAVTLSTARGSIVGANNSNLVTGKSVNLTANYGTGTSIGASNSARLHLNTEKLTMATPGSIYVDNLADLSDLTIIRNNAQGSNLGSAGMLTIDAKNLTFSGGDSNNATALTVVRDTTGLNFTYQAVGAINLHDIDVTQNGSVTLSTNPYYYTGGSIQGMNGSSKIVAGDLTLSTGTGDTPNTIGSAGLALNTQVKNIAATASGGIWLKQTGSINLGNLRAGGDLSVTTTTGDILVGTVSYGTGNALTLNAQTGSILYGGGTLSGAGAGAITLTAQNGIGTRDAAIKIAAPNSPVSATVTGDGSLYLDSSGNLLGGLTTSVANGETRITGNGSLALTSVTSGTDATGNDISVKTTSGNITVKNVQAGANHGQVTLNAENGSILADAAGATVKAYGVALNAANAIGASNGRINATGQRVEATTGGGMYLAADNNSVYSYLSGNTIDIAATGNLQIANAISSNGAIKITGNGTNSQLVAGNIDAGAGTVNIDFSKAGSTIVDDREESTRIIGNNVVLKAGAGIGGAAGSPDNLQTTAANITAEVTGAGAIYLNDNRAAGTTLASVITQNGAIGITTAGPTLVTSAISRNGSASNSISIATTSGDLSVNTIDASAGGDISLNAAGSILGAVANNLVLGNTLTAVAGGSIGSAAYPGNGSGGIALRTNLGALGNLSTAADGAVIVVNNIGTRALSANSGNIQQSGAISSVYLTTAGDLDASGGMSNTAANLLLSSGGKLTLASAGVQANGTITLKGTQDVVAAGATPRTINVKGTTLNFSSGAAGGNTTLVTEARTIGASLTGTSTPANLTLTNTGALDASLSAANGDISATATGSLNASATAAGSNRTIALTSQHGDVEIGIVNAGAASGTVILSAAEGSLLGLDNTLTANSLDLTSKTGIGTQADHFTTSARNLKANVLGSGDIYVDASGPLTLGRVATADGNIGIASAGNLASTVGLSAGNGGDVTLASTAGNVTVSHDIASADVHDLSVSGAAIAMAAANTSGSQAYTGNVTLNGDLTGSAIGITGNATLAGGKRTLTANGANGGVALSGALNGGAQQAVIVADDGDVTLGGNASNLASLTITGNNIDLRQVATTGAQQYNGATTLRGAYTTANGAFGVDGATTLASTVSVTTGSGAVAFTGAMSGANALTVTSIGTTTYGGAVDIASLNQAGSGGTAINGGSVTTSGTQTYVGHVTLGEDAVLTGATVTLANGADGAHALEIDGTALLTGAIGATTKLASLTLDGAATLNAGSIATTGNQRYKGAVTLSGVHTLSTTTGGVAFDGALDGTHDLYVVSTAGGDVSFDAVGSATQRLGSLTVDTAGTTAFNGSVYAASVQTDDPGAVTITGERVDTNGVMRFGELVTLGGNVTLKGASVTLAGGANATDERQGLTIEGPATINGPVGAGANGRLAYLTVDGDATLGGGPLKTVGEQSYQGKVELSGNAQLSTADAKVTFNDTVTSGNGSSLTVSSGSGDVRFAEQVGDAATGRLGALAVNSDGATTFEKAVYAASVNTDAGGTVAINGGLVDTTGTQSYGERALFGTDTVLKGSTVSLLGGGDGKHDLTIDGDAVLKGPLGANDPLASLTVKGNATLGAGSIVTDGEQSYQGNVTVGGNVSVTSRQGDIGFDRAVDGGHGLTVVANQGEVTFAGPVGQGSRLGDLKVSAAGDIVLDGPVRAASVQTGGNGDVLINGGSVDTTGTQQYGQHVILSGVDTTLSGADVQLKAGVDGTQPGQQGLVIVGNADIQGDVGATTPLRGLAVSGATTMGPGKTHTTGDQVYNGAVTLAGNRDLASDTGSVILGSKLDGGNGNNLNVNAGKNIQVAGDATGLGSLTLRAVDTIVFNGDVSAYRVQQLEAKSASYNGAVRASGPDGIDIAGDTLSFGKNVTADTGSIRIANTSPTGTTSFGAGSTVRAATGFTQTGGAGLTLPAQLLVTQGPINLGAPAKLQGGNAVIQTNGDITAIGLSGPQTSLTLASGVGALRIGLNDADPSHKLDVAGLTVPNAGSADMWGAIGGKTGSMAATMVRSSLVGAPYYMNGATWGPTDVIDRLAAVTAPRTVIPTTPTANPLFQGTVPSKGFGPDALGAYTDPQVLTVASAFTWQLPSGDNALLSVPAGNNPVLQTPGANPQRPAAEGVPSSDDARRDTDTPSRTL
ncbi:filamentous hemagglutinin N-terminal domain-containing protein [Achromobacter xylosoxidans]|uniref:filamentous hemagglutinin N-terminal domain-containing protein n=1 Tax=Alcaligenes xylosoxydans xylosoxydans TaxID=85698 RepID=UPI00156796EF|nr:filamentous hemagglutinin N-terminal domain-containing protein [Achromobacter xylosoxidans]MCH4580057.1 filamentous hemagglutinin N-terminal domain-containing protein [Achromobacter xylosoxidans]QKI78914.1 filamentous hemagglutinin N-terminal domain-containing protein [Achromobacter xylosoxidans]